MATRLSSASCVPWGDLEVRQIVKKNGGLDVVKCGINEHELLKKSKR